jgi:REP element-mobilizing transposase RayT
MPRRNHPFLPDHYYHFYNRGNNRQAIFFERINYLYFLQGMKRYLLPHLDVLAYCLMPTHYHLLVRVKPADQTAADLPGQAVTLETNLQAISESVSHAMQLLSISYTKAINKRYERVGSLFQGQFQGKWVPDERYLRTLCLYIHANPVKDALAANPADWEFSSHRDWMRMRDDGLADRGGIERHFGNPQDYLSLLQVWIETRCVSEPLRQYLVD